MIQQLFFDTVHHVNAGDYSVQQIQAWAPEQPDRDTWTALDQPFCYVVEYKRQIVGFASLHLDGNLDFLYVHKDFQNKGIAGNLLKQLERIAKKHKLEKIYTESSITAKGFFESKGFYVVQEVDKVIRGVSLVKLRMEKPLTYPAPK